MACDNCMKHRPDKLNDGHFKCPECEQIYVLAGVGPGNYWEEIEHQLSEINQLGINSESLGERIKYLKSLMDGVVT